METFISTVDKETLAMATTLYFRMPHNWDERMSTNNKLFAAALGNCGLSLVGSPLPAKPDKFTGAVENSITLHVLTHGQEAIAFPWHLVKMLTVYSMASTDAQGQTSVSGTPYHGVLTMNTKDRVKLSLCQKHFKQGSGSNVRTEILG